MRLDKILAECKTDKQIKNVLETYYITNGQNYSSTRTCCLVHSYIVRSHWRRLSKNYQEKMNG